MSTQRSRATRLNRASPVSRRWQISWPNTRAVEKLLKLVKVVISQTPHRLIQREIVAMPGRKLPPDRLRRLDGEAKLGGELPDLSFKDAIGALRLCLPRQRRDRFVRDYGLGKSLLMLGDASVKGDGRARAPCGGGRLRYGLAG